MDHIARPKKVTIADIANSVGVSKNSVSLALRGRAGVGDDLRRSIIEKAVEMGYLGEHSVPEFSQDSCIVVILPEYVHGDAFFYSDVLWAIDNEVKTRGVCSVHSVVSKEMEEAGELPAIPKGMHSIGVLVVGIFDTGYVEKLKEMELPVMTVDIVYDGLPYIGSSNITGGLAATNKLIELGHKEIGFVGPIHTATSVYERWCGYNLAMQRANLPVEDRFCVLGKQGFQLFNTEEALGDYINSMDKYPTAWFCAGDRTAIVMIHLLTKMGIRVPDDISIMGFDDILAAQMVLPCLTTIRTDRRLMGKLAVNYFFEARKDKDMVVVSKIVPFELVERDSVGVPPTSTDM
ncbi:MAG: LacI family DNA-binding transcriptional regulator [Defluviitaleaceae bacterium]|nr:LacI family DNA-binding transcriptional regulator [Defluviitaleaceae bacterium]